MIKKLLRVLLILLCIISIFFNGYLYKKPPKIITKEVIRENYDFTQKPEIIEAYVNFAGKTL
jgi:hypothetical protein